MSEPDEKALVAQILSSYLSNNTVAPADLPSVIESVKKAFGGSAEAISTPPSDEAYPVDSGYRHPGSSGRYDPR
jgi:predicted transcriptional regulator